MPGSDNAIEQVDSLQRQVNQVLRHADSHQVPRPPGRQQRSRHLDNPPHVLRRLTDTHAPDGVAWEIELEQLASGLLPEIIEATALDDTKERLFRIAPMGLPAEPGPSARCGTGALWYRPGRLLR